MQPKQAPKGSGQWRNWPSPAAGRAHTDNVNGCDYADGTGGWSSWDVKDQSPKYATSPTKARVKNER